MVGHKLFEGSRNHSLINDAYEVHTGNQIRSLTTILPTSRGFPRDRLFNNVTYIEIKSLELRTSNFSSDLVGF